MDTVHMSFENSKTSEHHRLLLNLADKRNLKRRHIYVAWSNLSIVNMEKYKKVIQKQIYNISSNMEWKIWSTWWIIFCIRYSKLFWIYL